MALIKKVNVLDYVPFTTSAKQPIRDRWVVDVEHLTVLETCQAYGVKLVELVEDGITQGIDICHRNGRVLGHVTWWGNPTWLHEILTDLAELVAEPAKYGLNRA